MELLRQIVLGFLLYFRSPDCFKRIHSNIFNLHFFTLKTAPRCTTNQSYGTRKSRSNEYRYHLCWFRKRRLSCPRRTRKSCIFRFVRGGMYVCVPSLCLCYVCLNILSFAKSVKILNHWDSFSVQAAYYSSSLIISGNIYIYIYIYIYTTIGFQLHFEQGICSHESRRWETLDGFDECHPRFCEGRHEVWYRNFINGSNPLEYSVIEHRTLLESDNQV